MNNNRNQNNNRRRGRGGSNRNNSGPPNRIDSRARGNAPQLLDKYKKLAHDASMNGDRVQAEYYLQFADHYFRVVADGKARQDEQRAKRDEERGRSQDDDGDDGDDGDGRENGRDDNRSEERRPRRARRQRDDRQDDDARGSDDAGDGDGDGDDDRDGGNDNPFTQPKRAARKPAARRPKKSDDADVGLDPGALPPAIGADDDTPKPRRRSVRRKSADGDGAEHAATGDDGAREAVG